MPEPGRLDPRWREKDPRDILTNPIESMPLIPNNELKGGFIGDPPPKDYSKEIKRLEEKVESLERLIKTIFDGHILINGRFVKI